MFSITEKWNPGSNSVKIPTECPEVWTVPLLYWKKTSGWWAPRSSRLIGRFSHVIVAIWSNHYHWAIFSQKNWNMLFDRCEVVVGEDSEDFLLANKWKSDTKTITQSSTREKLQVVKPFSLNSWQIIALYGRISRNFDTMGDHSWIISLTRICSPSSNRTTISTLLRQIRNTH